MSENVCDITEEAVIVCSICENENLDISATNIICYICKTNLNLLTNIKTNLD